MPAPEQRLPWRTDWSVLTPLDLGRDLFPFAALRQARQCRLYDPDGLFLAYRVVDAKVPANVKTQVYAFVYSSATELDGHYARTQVGKEEICLYFLQAGGALSLRLKLHPAQESKLRLRKGKRISDLRIPVTAAKLQRLKRQGISVATLLGLVAREDLPMEEDTVIEKSDKVPFNAGRARKKDPKEPGYAHGDIELEALHPRFKPHEIVKIYYGNWLRDFSQIAVPMIIRPPEGQRKKLEALARIDPRLQEILDLAQNQMSHESIVKLLEIAAVAEFVDSARDMREMDWLGPGRKTHNFVELLEVFRRNFKQLTKDILGIYRPEEHLDNPFGLPDESMLDYVQYQYEYKPGKKITVFPYAGQNDASLYNDCGEHSMIPESPRGMKHYLLYDIFPDPTGLSARPKTYYPSGTRFLMQQIELAAAYGRNEVGYRHLGAALHVLEDYFAHTNFCEISLIKIGYDGEKKELVYAYIQQVEETGYKWGDKDFSDQYRVVQPPYQIDEGEVSPLATYLPVVTGRFLTDDTLASLLPKVADAVFSTDYTAYYQLKAGERTMADMAILTILEEHTQSQAPFPYDQREKYFWWTAGEWLEFYQDFLYYVDMWRDVRDNSGVLEVVLVSLEKFLHSVGQVLKLVGNVCLNLMLGNSDEGIKIEQRILDAEYGTNPSHTILAKDDLAGPLNVLAGRLAVHAVRDVGARISEIWDKRNGGGAALAKYVATTYFEHPCKTKWMDKLVRAFAQESPEKVHDAVTPTEVEEFFEFIKWAKPEVDKVIKDIRELIKKP